MCVVGVMSKLDVEHDPPWKMCASDWGDMITKMSLLDTMQKFVTKVAKAGDV